MLTNRTQSPTLPTTGLTATMDELDKTAQFRSAYQDAVKLFGPGTGPGAAVGAGAGGMKLVEAGGGAAEVATLVALLLMDPVLIGPAEHELDDVTTENVFEAALSVALKVRPDKMID